MGLLGTVTNEPRCLSVFFFGGGGRGGGVRLNLLPACGTIVRCVFHVVKC